VLRRRFKNGSKVKSRESFVRGKWKNKGEVKTGEVLLRV